MNTLQPLSPELPKIALMMIVKNESLPLEKLLPTVKHLISEWIIIDTGSTDNTVEVIQKHLGNIPGILQTRPWINFGHNRSELVNMMPKTCDYALLLDADHIVALKESTLDTDGKISLTIPNADLLMIQVEEGQVVYRMPYFVRYRPDYFYVGATHEYLSAQGHLIRSDYDEIQILHTAEGGSRADKHERDLKLLSREIETNPTARNFFYLGQTLVGLNRLEDAITAYRRCVNSTAWDEEKYLALLRLGRILLEQKRTEEALVSFLLAHEAFTGRCEAAYEAGRIFNSLNLRKRAIEILNEGFARCPQTGILLIERWICHWGIETELGSAHWWADNKALAKTIFEKTLKKPDLPESAIELLNKNLSYCD